MNKEFFMMLRKGDFKFGTNQPRFSLSDEDEELTVDIAVLGKPLNDISIHQISELVGESLSKLRESLMLQRAANTSTSANPEKMSTCGSSSQLTTGSLKSTPVDIQTGVGSGA